MSTMTKKQIGILADMAARRAALVGYTGPALEWSKSADELALLEAVSATSTKATEAREHETKHRTALEAARAAHEAAVARHEQSEAPEDWTEASKAAIEVERLTALVNKAEKRAAPLVAEEEASIAELRAAIDRRVFAAMSAELQGPALHSETERLAADVVAAFVRLDSAIEALTLRSAEVDSQRKAATDAAAAWGLEAPAWPRTLETEVTAVARAAVCGNGERIAAFFVREHASSAVGLRGYDVRRVEVGEDEQTPSGAYRVGPTVAVVDSEETNEVEREAARRRWEARRQVPLDLERYQIDRRERAALAEHQARSREVVRLEGENKFRVESFVETNDVGQKVRLTPQQAIERAGNAARRAVLGEPYPKALVELYERAGMPLPPNDVAVQLRYEADMRARAQSEMLS